MVKRTKSKKKKMRSEPRTNPKEPMHDIDMEKILR